MELIRRKTDYGLRCLVNLAEAGKDELISVHTLAQREDIPEDLLHKVMQKLSDAKIVRATRGRSGGFCLAKAAENITVLEVLESLQGVFAISRCFMDVDRCNRQDICWLRTKLFGVQEEVVNFFRGVTIADLTRHGKR